MDWQKLLSAMVPVAGGVIGGVSGHPQQGAAFMHGFQQSDQLMWQRRMQEEEANRRRTALEAEQQNRADDNQRLDTQARLNRLTQALSQMTAATNQQAEYATDPTQAENALLSRSSQLESSYELPPSSLSGYVPPMAPIISQKKITRAKAKVAEFKSLYGDRLGEVADALTVHEGEFAGTKLADLLSMAQMEPPPKVSPKARPEAAPGSFEDYIARYAKELGRPVEDLTAVEIEKARKRYQQSDDKQASQQTPRSRYQVQQVTNPDGTSGLIRVDLDSGETTRIQLPTDVAGAGRPTAGEQNASLYLKRTEASNTTASRFESTLTALGPQFDVQMPNLLRTPAGQRYRQAQDEFINASLRRESGAAIQPSEYDRFAKIYFVMPGDTKETIAQKQEARKRVIDGFRTGAGNLQGPAAPNTGTMRARDPQGKLHEAPLGTPLPAGWTVEP